jgi:hypothetical protein
MVVMKNLYSLYKDYPNYKLTKNIKTRIELWLKYNEELTIEKLAKKIPFFEVNNFLYKNENGEKKRIKSLKYYFINDNIVKTIFKNHVLDITKLLLLKWENNGEFEYRLTYELILD